MSEIECTRCGQARSQLDGPPFKDDLGERIHGEICRTCWDDWLKRQMQLINHYALDVRQAEAREFLRRNARAFLFGSEEGDEIDTSQEGKISW